MENTDLTVKDGIEVEDGAYVNSATGLGKKEMDKGANTVVAPYTPADLVGLATMKVKDGIAAFIVDGFPTAALMNEVKIIGDEDGEVFKSASRKGMFKAVKKAGSYMRLSGGAVVVTEYAGFLAVVEIFLADINLPCRVHPVPIHLRRLRWRGRERLRVPVAVVFRDYHGTAGEAHVRASLLYRLEHPLS